jgi:alkylated DNA repair dioxygenase AlkB
MLNKRVRVESDSEDEEVPPSKRDVPQSICAALDPPVASPYGAGNVSILSKFIKPGQQLNVLYYPCFIPSLKAKQIFKELQEQLLTGYLANIDEDKEHIKIGGKRIAIPRRQTAFGDDGLTYTYSGVTVSSNPWLPLIKTLKLMVEDAMSERFNFALVNYYRNGSDYIGEHRDDEKDLVPGSSIASLSFGCERDFVFRHAESRGKTAKRKDIEPIKICLASGSLLMMKEPTNKMWYHSLPVRKSCHNVRINLTFRNMILKKH